MEPLEKLRSKGTHIPLALQLLALLLQTVHCGAKVYSDIIDYPQKCNFTKLMCNESRLLEEDKIIILNIANEMRNRVAGGSFSHLNLRHDPVSNMNKLSWNQDLEEKAASLVSLCPKTSFSFISQDTDILPRMDGIDYIRINNTFDPSTYKLDGEMPGCEVSTITYKEKLTLCAPQKIKERLIGYLTEGGLSAEARKYDMRDFWIINRFGEPRLTFRRAESTDVGCSYLIRADKTHYFSYLTCIHCIYNFTLPVIGHPGEACGEEYQHFDEKYENLCSDLRNEYDSIKKDQNEVICKEEKEKATSPINNDTVTATSASESSTRYSTTMYNMSTTSQTITSPKAASQKTTIDTESTDSIYNKTMTASVPKTKSTHGDTSLTPKTSIQSTSKTATKNTKFMETFCNDTQDFKMLAPHCNKTKSTSRPPNSSISPSSTEPSPHLSCKTTIVRTLNTLGKKYSTTPSMTKLVKTHLPITSSTKSIVPTQHSQSTKQMGTNCWQGTNDNISAPVCKSSSLTITEKPTVSTLSVNSSTPRATKFFNTTWITSKKTTSLPIPMNENTTAISKETSYVKFKTSTTSTPLPTIFTTCRKTTALTTKHSNTTTTAISSTTKSKTSTVRKTSPKTASTVITTTTMITTKATATPSKKKISSTYRKKTTQTALTKKLNTTTTTPISTTVKMITIITTAKPQNNENIKESTQRQSTASTIDISKTTIPDTKFNTTHCPISIICNQTTFSNYSFISPKTTLTYSKHENISTSSSDGNTHSTVHSVKIPCKKTSKPISTTPLALTIASTYLTSENISLTSPSTKFILSNISSTYSTIKNITSTLTNVTTISPIMTTCRKTTTASHTLSSSASSLTFSTTKNIGTTIIESSSTKLILPNTRPTYSTTKNITSPLTNATTIRPIMKTCRKTTATSHTISSSASSSTISTTKKNSTTNPSSSFKFLTNATTIRPIMKTCRKTTATSHTISRSASSSTISNSKKNSTTINPSSTFKLISPNTTSTYFTTKNITLPLSNSTTIRSLTTTRRKTTATSHTTPNFTSTPTFSSTKNISSTITSSCSIKFAAVNTTSTYFTLTNITSNLTNATTIRPITTTCRKTTMSSKTAPTIRSTTSTSRNISAPTCTTFISSSIAQTYPSSKNINSTQSSTTFMKTLNLTTTRTIPTITEASSKTMTQSTTSTTKCRKTKPTNLTITVLPTTTPTFTPSTTTSTRSTNISSVTTTIPTILTPTSIKTTKLVITSMKSNTTSSSSKSTCKKTAMRSTTVPTTVPILTESIFSSTKSMTSRIITHLINTTISNITPTKSLTTRTERISAINTTTPSNTPKSENIRKSSFSVQTRNPRIFSTLNISKCFNTTHFTFTRLSANITNFTTTSEPTKNMDQSTFTTRSSTPTTIFSISLSSSSLESTSPTSTLTPTEKSTVLKQPTAAFSTFLCDPCKTADDDTRMTPRITFKTVKSTETPLTSKPSTVPTFIHQETTTKNAPQTISYDHLSTKSEFRQNSCVCVNWYMIGLIFIIAFLFAWCLICWQRVLLF